MTEEQIKTCNCIANHYGKENQTTKFVEECAEAITAVQKLKQVDSSEDCVEAYDNLLEEIADVRIMVEQMIQLHSELAINAIIDRKLKRQLHRMADGRGY